MTSYLALTVSLPYFFTIVDGEAGEGRQAVALQRSSRMNSTDFTSIITVSSMHSFLPARVPFHIFFINHCPYIVP